MIGSGGGDDRNGPWSRWRLGGSVFVLAVLVAALPGPARAATARTAGADSVVAVSDPGTALAVPVDGRLRGWRFAARVTGVATGESSGGANAVDAAAGQRLWVFGLDVAADVDSNDDLPPITAAVVVDGSRIGLPLIAGSPNRASGASPDTTWDSGTSYWMASVPAAASDVAVELASGGYAQRFSLSKMAREGDQPAVLYHDPVSWQLTQPLSDETDLATPDPTGDTPDAALPVRLSGVTLSWFGPDHPSDQPSGPSQQWLVADLSSLTYADSGNGMCYPPLSGSQVTLTVAGQAAQDATVFPGLGPDRTGFGAFTGIYAFEVPAGLTTATLTVNPGQMAAQTDNCAVPVTVTAQGQATFAITIPAATYTAPAGAATVPATIQTLRAAAPGRAAAADPARGPTGSGFPWLAVVLPALALAALSGSGVVIRRRNRTQPPPGPVADDPSPDSPPERPPGPTPAPAAPGPEPPPQQPPPVLLVPPAGPPPLDDDAREVQVLGRPRIMSGQNEGPAVKDPALEVLVWMAFHSDRLCSGEQISTALGRGREKDRDPATIRRYINDLRRALGDDALPEARSSGGFQLVGIGTDVDRLDAALHVADSADSVEDRAAHLAAALSLVRGIPFDDRSKGGYGWTDSGQQLSHLLVNRVIAAGEQLTRISLAAGDRVLAGWAARQALRASPTQESLHTLLLDVADTGPAQLDQVWDEINRQLKAEYAEPSPSLTDYHQQLRKRWHNHQ